MFEKVTYTQVKMQHHGVQNIFIFIDNQLIKETSYVTRSSDTLAWGNDACLTCSRLFPHLWSIPLSRSLVIRSLNVVCGLSVHIS